MSSSTEYVNAYLENSIGTLHDYLNQILQLKTQLKLATDSLSSKDATIAELTNQVESVKKELDAFHQTHSNDSEAVNAAKTLAQKLQNENDSIKHRLNEFDALVKQFTDLKTQYKDKENEIQKLSSELSDVNKTLNDRQSELNDVNKALNERELEIKDLKNLIPKEPATPIVSVKKPINTKNTPMQSVNKHIEENDDF